MKRFAVVLVATAVLVLSAPAGRAQGTFLSSDAKALLSRLQAMGHGYHSQAEWDQLLGDINRMEDKAQADGAWETVVEINVIEAMVYSDMMGQQEKALTVLKETRQAYAKKAPASMPKVYVRMAEVYSKLGAEETIRRLINEFKSSRFYDPEKYTYKGGWGRDVPLELTRPGARGDDSLSVTTMEMYRQRARFAPGRPFPEFEAVDTRGVPVRLADYRGRVVLIDFWLQGWEPWQRELANVASLYQRYNKSGFEIIGVNLEPAPTGLNDFVRAYNMVWPQIAGDRTLPKKLGIFGEAASFLVDREGFVIGRDLRGAELVQAVRQALAPLGAGQGAP